MAQMTKIGLQFEHQLDCSNLTARFTLNNRPLRLQAVHFGMRPSSLETVHSPLSPLKITSKNVKITAFE